MPPVYLFLGLTVISNVIYHLVQKVTPQGVNPMLALAVSYLVATLTCVALLPLFPLKTSLGAALRQVNWASVALGISVVGLELGFLLAYRAGWAVSLGPIVSTTAVTLILLPIGLLAFKDTLSALNIGGVLVCIAGLVMLNWK
jgi:uncharacterized membrane protein